MGQFQQSAQTARRAVRAPGIAAQRHAGRQGAVPASLARVLGASRVRLNVRINGEWRVIDAVAPTARLLDVLREDLALVGTKDGCGEGRCGACTVQLDGEPVCACLVPAAHVDGRAVRTVEDLASSEGLSPLQQAFIDAGAVQCGFCTPGILMTAEALLRRVPTPTEQEVRLELTGNLCRCTGYVKIVDAVRLAAARLQAL